LNAQKNTANTREAQLHAVRVLDARVFEVRVVDESRTPRDWNLLLGPAECAVFCKRVGSETPLSADGEPFARFSDATFVLMANLDEARAFCEARVAEHPEICCEIYDQAGKAKPPLAIVLHPREAAKDEMSAASVRKRTALAVGLVLAAPLFFWWDHRAGGTLVMPTYVGITLLLIALRIWYWNFARKERSREEARRVEEYWERVRGAKQLEK
jgi:hypothetical protein